jgi:hypothetical protein
MAEHKGDYLKQHIWNIIQCVIGLGCLAFEWMAYRNTRPGSSVTAALPAGTTMTQNYSIPWYLWAGITALILQAQNGARSIERAVKAKNHLSLLWSGWRAR